MKSLLVAALVGTFVATSAGSAELAEAPKTKTVCTDVKDKQGNLVRDKKGATKQNCKTVRVHKKFEGTKVPAK